MLFVAVAVIDPLDKPTPAFTMVAVTVIFFAAQGSVTVNEFEPVQPSASFAVTV